MAQSSTVTAGTTAKAVDDFNALRDDVLSTTLGHLHDGTNGREHFDGQFKLRNPGDTFSYILKTSAILANQNLTVPLLTGADTLAVLALAQTFTGQQTFTDLVATTVDINGGTIDGVTIGATVAPAQVKVQDNALQIENPAADFKYTITGAAIVADRVLNLPLTTATDTLVVLALAQTLTAKTLVQPTIADFVNAGHNHQDAVGGATLGHNAATDNPTVSHGATGAVVGTTNTQTLSAKTLTSPTITTSPTAAGATWGDLGSVTTIDINGGTVDGVTIGAAAAPSQVKVQDNALQIENPAATFKYTITGAAIAADRALNLPLTTATDTLVALGLAQTLTNKTLTSPTITTSPTAAGATWGDLGSVTTIDINGGTIDGVSIGQAVAATAITVDSLTLNGTTLSSSGDLTLSAAAGSDVLVGDDVTLLYLDGGEHGGVGAVGVGTSATNNVGVRIGHAALTAAASTNYSVAQFFNPGAVTIPSGTTDRVGMLVIEAPDITATGTVTNAFSLRISAAPTEGTNNYALWVDAGESRFDEDVAIGPVTPSVRLHVVEDASGASEIARFEADGSNTAARITYYSNRTDAGDRNWATGIGIIAEGDFAFLVSAAADGDPLSGGTTVATMTASTLDLQSNTTLLNVGAAGNDWTADTLAVAGTNTQTIRVDQTGTTNNANLQARVAASSSGVAQIIFTEGLGSGAANNMQYEIGYDSSADYLKLTSRDTDGASADADIWRVPDGQTTIDANTTWDINVFDDYDDAMVLSPYRQGVINLAARRRDLISMGVLRQYRDGWVGYNDQRMAALLAGGIYQNRQRMDQQHDETIARFSTVDDRLEAVEEANRILREQLVDANLIPEA